MEPKSVMHGSELTIYLTGEIDHHSARKMREAADSLIQQKKPSLLKLNFAGVTFMDSSGIGLVMGRYRTMLLYGGSVRVVNIPENLRRIMELSGLGSLNILERSGELETVK
ncbi:MAG: anti-sigma factor antagonist [Clostridia bacterium]|nr:anti-sigma factor antagonist [Clostridia bacterium]